MNVGVPELVIMLVIAGVWLIPVAAAIWALITLQRIRSGQQAVQQTLESIVRLLQRP